MSNKTKSSRKIASFICFVLAIMFIGLTVRSIASSSNDDSGNGLEVLGYRPVIVVSGSMEPAIAVNSISIMQYCNIDDIEVGEVVMYRHPSLNINITHRVIDKSVDSVGNVYLTTKGDANDLQDNLPITNDMIVGKLVKTYNGAAPYLNFIMLKNGEVNTFALIQLILLLAVSITVFGMLIYFVWLVISSAFIVIGSDRKTQNIVDTYNDSLEYQQKILPTVNNLRFQKGDSARVVLAKIILARELRTVEESIKDIQKAYNIASKVGGEKFNNKDE